MVLAQRALYPDWHKKQVLLRSNYRVDEEHLNFSIIASVQVLITCAGDIDYKFLNVQWPQTGEKQQMIQNRKRQWRENHAREFPKCGEKVPQVNSRNVNNMLMQQDSERERDRAKVSQKEKYLYASIRRVRLCLSDEISIFVRTVASLMVEIKGRTDRCSGA